MNTVTTRNGNANSEIMEAVLIKGDLSKLTPQERADFYMATCRSLGLNPTTRPFDYLVLNGKLVLYARRDCTDQLRSIHEISVLELSATERESVHIVTCKVSKPNGRTDISRGAVNIAKLQGEALANAIMKAETKAKRRATLSICGLGILDETEVEDIPASVRQNPHVNRVEEFKTLPSDKYENIPQAAPPEIPVTRQEGKVIYAQLMEEMHSLESLVALDQWGKELAGREEFRQLVGKKGPKEDWQDMLRGEFLEYRTELLAMETELEPLASPEAT